MPFDQTNSDIENAKPPATSKKPARVADSSSPKWLSTYRSTHRPTKRRNKRSCESSGDESDVDYNNFEFPQFTASKSVRSNRRHGSHR